MVTKLINSSKWVETRRAGLYPFILTSKLTGSSIAFKTKRKRDDFLTNDAEWVKAKRVGHFWQPDE